MAGKVCKLFHPNQVKRQYESAAEGQVASLKNQAATQLQETLQQKNILLSQIEALSLDARQQIENEYQASYLAVIEEFAKSQAIHEESLIALSYFWVYGRAIINAEEAVQQQSIAKANVDKYNQQLLNLAAEKENITNAFNTNYKAAVREETDKFASLISEYRVVLEALSLDNMRNHDQSYTNAHNAADKRYPAPDLETMENDIGNEFTNKR